ncbi:MAG TPA: hypothetical protein VFT65_16090 [Candidatus Angelobacter sp.]|nr:hypothetical protein [Candidatus Angelobacter sp.]
MHRYGLKFGVLAAALFFGTSTFAQQGFPGTRQSVQGQLTVVATVVSSVGMVVGPDGEQRLIVANAVDPRDNVSRLQTVRLAGIQPEKARQQREPAKQAAKLKSGN